MPRTDQKFNLTEHIRNLGQLNLPPIKPRVTVGVDGVVRIFDRLRRRAVALTPEEWVRQHFVEMLIEQMGYSEGLMANEVPITLNGTSRRCDTVVYSREGLKPLAIVEYKAAGVRISQRTFDQIVRYNMVLQVPWLIVSNGMNHFCCRVDYAAGTTHFQPALPTYSELAYI